MRLVDADALGVGRCSKDILPAAYCAGWNGLLNIINDAPTIDAVPVVRCRECKHWSRYKGRWENHCAGECERHNMEGGTYENDFCSYGQRKEAEDEDVQ